MRLSTLHYKSIKNSDTLSPDPVIQWLIQVGFMKFDRLTGVIVTPFGKLMLDSYRKEVNKAFECVMSSPLGILAYTDQSDADKLFHFIFEMSKFDFKSYKALPAALKTEHTVMTGALSQPLQQLNLFLDEAAFLKAIEAFEAALSTVVPVPIYAAELNDIKTGYTVYSNAPESIVICPACGYGAEVMLASGKETHTVIESEVSSEHIEVYTPNMKTILEVSAFLSVEASSVMKAVALMRTDGQPLMAMLAGNKNLSIPKLSRLSGHQYRMATDSEIESCFKSVPGFVGPVERDGICQILWDRSLKSVTNGVCGANRKDYHYTQVAVTANNFGIEAYVDIAAYEIGERCPVCGGEMALTKGEQLYQTIAYGTSLSEIHRANYLDAAGKAQRHWGLGLTFDMMAGIKSVVRHHICSEFTDIKCAEIDSEETAHMQIGIEALLPFDIWLIVMNVKKASQCELAEAVYDRLTAMGIRVMYDDRSDSPGIKFFDAEQLGNLPRIVVGKSAEEGLCNLQTKSEQFGPMTLEEVLHWVINH